MFSLTNWRLWSFLIFLKTVCVVSSSITSWYPIFCPKYILFHPFHFA
jgi:hypothetical protein